MSRIASRSSFDAARCRRSVHPLSLYLLLALIVLGGSTGWAQNVTLTYQGNLFDANGDPVDAQLSMSFSLYENDEGGPALWTEVFNPVDVLDGAFAVELGSTINLPEALTDFGTLFLGVTVENGAEMVPRMTVGSALQAQWAAQTTDLEGRDINPNSISINGLSIVNDLGEWIGESTGLEGPPGLGIAQVSVNLNGELIVEYSDLSTANVGVIIGAQGDTGPQGLQGDTGPQGLIGPEGPAGLQGLQGDTGPQGPAGLQGLQGDTGPQGPAGLQGLQGDTGPQGPAGLQGLHGDTGPQGPAGLQGLQGDIGPQGPAGLQGLQGDTGPQGPAGLQGLQGDTGPQGLVGPEGPAGLQGLQGDIGPQGLQGDTGLQGLVGPEGPAGLQGLQGDIGPQGLIGPEGPAGLQGDPGPAGNAATSISAANIDENGDLIFVLSNDDNINAGNLLGHTACTINAVTANGVAVIGNVTITCGNQPPIELTTVRCGNGELDPGEVCDDGNRLNHDGCDNRCMNECEDLKFTGANCDACVDPMFTGPNCDECTDPTYKGETCEECADETFTGVHCDECADPRFGGVNCDECVGFGVGENCEPAPCVAAGTCPDLGWVNITGGAFDMGAIWKPSERPIHEVVLPNYRIMQKEVTVAQYRACVEAGVCTPPACTAEDVENDVGVCNYAQGRENHPVNFVNWFDAHTFAEWVGASLPSESQWEYAARSRGIEQMYPWGVTNPSCDYANLDGCHGTGTTLGCAHPLGNSTQGICDFGGNVSEWILDAYYATYDDAPNDGTARCFRTDCTVGDQFRVIRGGAWNSPAGNLRNTIRSFLGPIAQAKSLGFRLAAY